MRENYKHKSILGSKDNEKVGVPVGPNSLPPKLSGGL